eukprot:Hpha_TRINITY_DN15054_c2_g1::TRINITY_DN15054_c2_g1_i1::g.125924::m.125924/K11135/PINX1; Pin2-interacting protein X1
MPKDRSLRDDKNNTHWRNNKDKWCFKLMERMGWQEGKGLGKQLDGSVEHVKISVKTTDAGIGAKLDHGAWKENFRSMDNMFGRLGADNAAAEQGGVEEETGGDGDVFIPQSPKMGGVILKSSRVSHNRKLQRAKLEHRADARNRKQVLGLAGSPHITAAKPPVDSEEEEDEGVDFFKTDQLTAVQVKKTVSLTDYFNSKARALGHEVMESSSAGTFLAFNSGFGIKAGGAEEEEAEEEDDEKQKKKKAKKEKKEK